MAGVAIGVGSATRTGPRTARRGRPPGRSRGWIFVIPALAINLLVVGIPCIATFVLSLYNWSGIGAAHFIGLSNFAQLFTQDPVFVEAITHVLVWTAFFLTIPVALALGAALFDCASEPDRVPA